MVAFKAMKADEISKESVWVEKRSISCAFGALSYIEIITAFLHLHVPQAFQTNSVSNSIASPL